MQQSWKKPAEIKKKPTERKPASSSVAVLSRSQRREILAKSRILTC
ncbi:hypothetical protein SOVF_073670 [Spinacia oleracea]|nr:hypothetical protein SOVF_073670 [Spinacia oleracea]